MIRNAFIVLLALALSGCGFHLRNALVLPPDLGPVQVASNDPYSPLALELSQALARIGATPAAQGVVDDVATLDLVSEQWGNLPLSIDERGRAQEFTLRYAVVFELRGADDRVLVPRQVIELSRDYISVPTRSIGTDSERDILTRELQREMSASVLRRIDAAARGASGQ